VSRRDAQGSTLQDTRWRRLAFVRFVDRREDVTSGIPIHAGRVLGVDTHYVLTGTRHVSDLTPVETVLLDNYRNSPEAGKDAIRRTAFALAQQEVKGEAA
jgi:hypothetical protein